MNTLQEDARATMARVKRDICAKMGCKMDFAGGANAGCGDACCCSVPVHICTRCGDSDYGDNEEATQIRSKCRERRLEEAGCDCQCPEPTDGVALISENCPVHG